MPLDPNSSEPPYRQLAHLLAARIEAGEYAPGAALPSGAALAAEAGVSRVTVQSALKVLKEQGLVVGRQGSGVFVRVQLSSVEAMFQAIGAPGAVAVDLYGLTGGEVRREVRKVVESMPEGAHGLVVRAVCPSESRSHESASLGKADVVDGGGALATELVRSAHAAGVRAVAVNIIHALTAPGGSFTTIRPAKSIDSGLDDGLTAEGVATGRDGKIGDAGRQAWFDQEWRLLSSTAESAGA